jgi:hypothetical protein
MPGPSFFGYRASFARVGPLSMSKDLVATIFDLVGTLGGERDDFVHCHSEAFGACAFELMVSEGRAGIRLWVPKVGHSDWGRPSAAVGFPHEFGGTEQSSRAPMTTIKVRNESQPNENGGEEERRFSLGHDVDCFREMAACIVRILGLEFHAGHRRKVFGQGQALAMASVEGGSLLNRFDGTLQISSERLKIAEARPDSTREECLTAVDCARQRLSRYFVGSFDVTVHYDGHEGKLKEGVCQ